ncbi:hypothetical protein LguiA_024472 [Lonicera macranthoides]
MTLSLSLSLVFLVLSNLWEFLFWPPFYPLLNCRYIITVGAVTALCAALIGGILPQPRILMAMARDGLLPSFFSDVNKRTHVPVKSTIVTGIFIATLAFFMDVSQLAGMVSVGTLLAFTTVAVSVLILRYVPPHEVPIPPSLPELIDSISLDFSNDSQEISRESTKDPFRRPLIQKEIAQDEQNEARRRKIAAWSIAIVCIGVIVLTSAASAEKLPSIPRLIFCGMGGIILLCGLIVLTCIDQDVARLSFGHTGGFICPFVPLVPVTCILVNTYLLINLGGGTWIRVSSWMAIGALVYIFYGRTHSLLLDGVYVPIDDGANETLYCSSSKESLHKA